jgi:endonuclease G, mitochondrial
LNAISIIQQALQCPCPPLSWQRDYDSEKPLPFAPVLEQVRLTTIEVLTGLTFPALRAFDPLLFDQQGRRRDTSISRARELLRRRMVRPFEAARKTDSELGEDLLLEATSPGTAAITSMRDIVAYGPDDVENGP